MLAAGFASQERKRIERREVRRPEGSFLSRWTSPYRAREVSPVNLRNSQRIFDLMRAGQLYLSLDDAIALALENNLDIELERFLPKISRYGSVARPRRRTAPRAEPAGERTAARHRRPEWPAVDESHGRVHAIAARQHEFLRYRADQPAAEQSVGDRHDPDVERPGYSSIRSDHQSASLNVQHVTTPEEQYRSHRFELAGPERLERKRRYERGFLAGNAAQRQLR